jgi:hypothetical protein
MVKHLVTVELKERVRVIRETGWEGFPSGGIIGSTMHYGMKIGTRGPGRTLVKVTENNKVKVITFNTSQVVSIYE